MACFFKKTTLLSLLIATLLITGCYTSYSVIVQNYKYDQDIGFTIDKVEEGSNISTGNGSYYAKKGFKFVFLHTTLTNNANELKKLDFANFYLLDPKTHTRYKAEFAMMEGAFNVWGHVNSEIQKNDTKRRKLVFTFPKDEKPEMFSVNDVVYNIKYSASANN